MEVDETDLRAEARPAGASQRHERLGARLSAARHATGVELADIARETRIPLRHLAAIEGDAHDELPALPYAVGFVKSLARAVGVDPDEAAAQFRAETSKVAHVPAVAALELLDERRLPSRGLVAASVAALVLVVGGLTAYGAGWFDAAPEATVAIADAPVVDADVPSDTVDTATSDAPAPTLPPVSSPAVADAAVSIVAADDAWVRITAFDATSGKIVSIKTGLLAKGERFDLPATPGQRLWTGRAGALQLTVGGRAVPALGGPVETVKNVSLAPADLLARIAPAAPVAATGVQ